MGVSDGAGAPSRGGGRGTGASVRAAPEAVNLPLGGISGYTDPSVFRPENLLREGRRQRRLPDVAVPRVVVLDPDGDIVRHLAGTGRAVKHLGWACYHTDMWVTTIDGVQLGFVGMAVGAPFAVLVAEQLAASGAELVISITSAGEVTPTGLAPCFVLIDRALRDEGTSRHYVPPARWSVLDSDLQRRLRGAFDTLTVPVVTGFSWTTDAPYRETAAALAEAAAAGISCVEMEAAALYAYAAARSRAVVCLAHITNTMATDGDDFEKGVDNGVHEALAVACAVARCLRHPNAGTAAGPAPYRPMTVNGRTASDR